MSWMLSMVARLSIWSLLEEVVVDVPKAVVVVVPADYSKELSHLVLKATWSLLAQAVQEELATKARMEATLHLVFHWPQLAAAAALAMGATQIQRDWLVALAVAAVLAAQAGRLPQAVLALLVKASVAGVVFGWQVNTLLAVAVAEQVAQVAIPLQAPFQVLEEMVVTARPCLLQEHPSSTEAAVVAQGGHQAPQRLAKAGKAEEALAVSLQQGKTAHQIPVVVGEVVAVRPVQRILEEVAAPASWSWGTR